MSSITPTQKGYSLDKEFLYSGSAPFSQSIAHHKADGNGGSEDGASGPFSLCTEGGTDCGEWRISIAQVCAFVPAFSVSVSGMQITLR